MSSKSYWILYYWVERKADSRKLYKHDLAYPNWNVHVVKGVIRLKVLRKL